MQTADSLFGNLADALSSDWSSTARPNQLPPAGEWWRIWLLLAGRGFGKTRTVCEYGRGEVEAGRAARVAIVAATAGDCRDVLVEGPAGILAISPKWCKPTYEPTKRRLSWPNGAVATLYSADEPERLRGPQHDLALCDELAAWRYPEAFDMLLLGLRLGKSPRVAIATTPRPTRIIRELIAREGKDVAVTRGSTLENRENLAPAYIEQIIERYRGTRLERQEVFGELLEDTPGALWSRENLEQTRVSEAPAMQRIVVGIDPAGSSEEGADETGIIVAGLGQDGHAYVLDDLSGRYAPTEWARQALGAYHVWKADRIVAETNYGGEMVKATIEAVDPSIPVKTISSSRGKVLRAEPIAAYFVQRKGHVVGSQPELEDQACRFTSDWTRARDGSPDRVDAMVFALTELMLGAPVGGFIKVDSLLARPVADGARVPIEVPRYLDGLFASVAAGVGADPESVGVVFFGFDKCGNAPAPLIVLDWSVFAIESGTFELTFPWLAEHFARLAGETTFLGSVTSSIIGATLIETQGLGEVLQEMGARGGHDTYVIEDEQHLTMTYAQRAVAAAALVAAGHVLLTRPANEELREHRGVTRNHLLHAIGSFGMEQTPEQASALLIAFCNGVLDAFRAPELRRRLSAQ